MDDYEDIVLLEEFSDALVGCVYDSEGNPVPCYVAEKVWERLAAEGFNGEEADDYIDHLTEGMRVVWIHPLELRPDFEPDNNKPHLRLVH